MLGMREEPFNSVLGTGRMEKLYSVKISVYTNVISISYLPIIPMFTETTKETFKQKGWQIS